MNRIKKWWRRFLASWRYGVIIVDKITPTPNRDSLLDHRQFRNKKKNMNIKTQDNNITISYNHKLSPSIRKAKTSFIIKAADVNEEQTLKIANILFPDFIGINVESIVNDELTLNWEDYHLLHMMINDRLLSSMKSSKTTYENISHPADLRDKKLLEKMTSRMNQFQQISV